MNKSPNSQTIDSLNKGIEEVLTSISIDGIGGSEAFIYRLQNRISDLAGRISSDIVRSCPAIHFAFSDRNDDPEFNLSPSVNVKTNGKSRQFTKIDKGMLSSNVVRDSLSTETLNCLSDMIDLSEMLKGHGFDGLQSIRGMDETTIEIVMYPLFNADSERLKDFEDPESEELEPEH